MICGKGVIQKQIFKNDNNNTCVSHSHITKVKQWRQNKVGTMVNVHNTKIVEKFSIMGIITTLF